MLQPVTQASFLMKRSVQEQSCWTFTVAPGKQGLAFRVWSLSGTGESLLMNPGFPSHVWARSPFKMITVHHFSIETVWTHWPREEDCDSRGDPWGGSGWGGGSRR